MSVDIASLPLVLAGPILRRVTNVEVNVWLALRDARDVTLQLFDASTSTPAGTATASSQRVGDHLVPVHRLAMRDGAALPCSDA